MSILSDDCDGDEGQSSSVASEDDECDVCGTSPSYDVGGAEYLCDECIEDRMT
jgi:hypothetical protein